MRIAILVAGFPPKWLAGTEIATYNIARHLAKLGHEVHVVTSLDEGLAKESTEEGFCIHRVRGAQRSNLFTLSFLIPAFLAIRKIKPDVVHTQSITMGLCATLIKKILKKPYVVYSRGELYMSWAFKSVISKLVLRNADGVIALTNDMKKNISEIYAGNVYVIPNGIEVDRFVSLSKRNSREELNIAEGDKVVIFVGRFRPEKDIACLIRAMEILVARNPKVRALIIGEGPEEEKLVELTRKVNLDRHVNFAGQVAPKKVPEYMAAADVFVLPSLSEGFPGVILEAMASGLPVVATRVTGIPEIITDGENGFLVSPGDYKQIAEAVLPILENDELSQRMSENNKTKVKQYSWRNTVQMLEEVYMQVSKGNQLGSISGNNAPV